MENTPNNINETTNPDDKWSVLINDNQDGDDKISSGENNQETETPHFEQLVSGKEYQDFARQMFNYTVDQLNNKDGHNEEMDNAILAIVFPIMGIGDKLEPTTPADLFEGIRQSCLQAAQDALDKSHTRQAKAFQLQAEATNEIERLCHSYMLETHDTTTSSQTESDKPATSPAENNSSETADKIA